MDHNRCVRGPPLDGFYQVRQRTEAKRGGLPTFR
jgi:hypothetical protein